MDCAGVEALIRTWESGRNADALSLATARAHAASCAMCRSRFEAVLIFAARDTAEGSASIATSFSLSPGFVDRVFGRIEGERHRSRTHSTLLVAAAAALFFVGAGFGARMVADSRTDTVSVLFVLDAPMAKSVSLVGDFDKWNPAVHALSRKGPAQPWELRLDLPRGRMYVYDFVIDGTRWVPDPSVEARVEDGFGGAGSLLRL